MRNFREISPRSQTPVWGRNFAKLCFAWVFEPGTASAIREAELRGCALRSRSFVTRAKLLPCGLQDGAFFSRVAQPTCGWVPSGTRNITIRKQFGKKRILRKPLFQSCLYSDTKITEVKLLVASQPGPMGRATRVGCLDRFILRRIAKQSFGDVRYEAGAS